MEKFLIKNLSMTLNLFSDGFRCDKDGNIWTSAGKAIKCLIKISV